MLKQRQRYVFMILASNDCYGLYINIRRKILKNKLISIFVNVTHIDKLELDPLKQHGQSFAYNFISEKIFKK